MMKIELDLEARDRALDNLLRLKGMLGAVIYLMGGEDRALEYPLDDFEVWLSDIRERLDEAIEALCVKSVDNSGPLS